MRHIQTAAEILFGGTGRDGVITLDNAIRGHYIEALIWGEFRQHNERRPVDSQWMNAGVNWGPWDLQRGRFDAGNRVRVQVKIKADKQLWVPTHNRPPEYSLGLNKREPPKYFSRDFDSAIYGPIDTPPSYRCDLFLLGWHGCRPGEPERSRFDQTNPDEYDFMIVPVSVLAPGTKTLRVDSAFSDFCQLGEGGPWQFADLPTALDAAADRFLSAG